MLAVISSQCRVHTSSLYLETAIILVIQTLNVLLYPYTGPAARYSKRLQNPKNQQFFLIPSKEAVEQKEKRNMKE